MSIAVDPRAEDAPAARTPEASPAPRSLVGRDTELAQLEEVWGSVRHGCGRLALLEGEAGSGKTRVVQAFLDAAAAGGALVLSGACDDGDPVPFGPLRRALDDMLRPVVEGRDGGVTAARRLRDAAGPFASVLKRCTRRVAAVLADVPHVPACTDAPGLFVDGLAELLLRLPAGRQTVVALDDVQWLDDPSRQVLLRLLPRIAAAPLLVLLAVRRDAADAAGIARLRDAVEPRAVTRVPFEARAADRVAALIESQLLLRRIDDLGERAKAILATAAVIGPCVRMALLRAAAPDQVGVVHAAVDAAVAAHLVERAADDTIVFTHGLVRTALRAELDPPALREHHQRVAEALAEGGDVTGGDVYALARHAALGDAPGHACRIYETNLAAGLAALADAANEEARSFLDEAERAAAAAGIGAEPALQHGLADACARTGRVDEAADHLERALAATTAPVARAHLRARLAQLHLLGIGRDLGSARAHLEQGYRELGASIPGGSAVELVVAAGHAAVAALARRVPLVQWLLPVCDEADAACAALDHHAAVLATAEADTTALLQRGLQAFLTAVRDCPSAAQSRSYAACSDLLGTVGRSWVARRFADLAVEIAQSLGDRVAVGFSRASRAVTLNAIGEALESEREHRRVLEAYEPWLPIGDRLAAGADLAWNLWSRGRDRDALAAVDQGLRRAMLVLSTPDRVAADPMLAVVEHLVAWQGRPREAGETLARCAAIVAAEAAGVGAREPRLHLAMLACARASALLAEGDLGARFDAVVAEHRRLGLHPMTEPLHTRLFYVYQAYARLQQCMRSAPAERVDRVDRLRAAVAALRRAAHIPVLRCHRLVVEASLRRLEGRRGAASQALAEAEELAAEVDAPWAVFEIFRQRAHLLAARGRGEIAGRYAAMARDVAMRQGWTVRAQWIEAEFPSTARGPRYVP